VSDRARQELLTRARARMEEQGRRGLRRMPPRPRRPEQQIRAYQAALRRVTASIEETVRELVFPVLDDLLDEAGTRSDAERLDDWGQRLRDLFNATRSSIQPVIGRTRELMLSLGDDTTERASGEVVRAIRATLGVAPTFYDDDRVRGILNAWKAQNEAFITRMADDAIEQMMDTASRAVRQGRPTREVKDELRKRFGISDRRARTIARTEISQLNAQVTRERQREVGIEGYIWVATSDDRTRDEHADLDGTFVAWDDPPSSTDGLHAGEPVMCRCVSRAAVDRLLDQLEAE